MQSLLSNARRTLPVLQLALQHRKTVARTPARFDKAMILLSDAVDGLYKATQEVKQSEGLRRARAKSALTTAEKEYTNALTRCYRLLGTTSKRG